MTGDGNTYIAPAPYTADAVQPEENPVNAFGDPRLLATAAPTAMTGWGPDAMGFDTLDSDGTVFHGFYGGMGTTWIKLHIPGPGSLPEDQIRNAWVQYIVYATNNETGEMDTGFHTDEAVSESGRLPDSHRLSREIDDLGTAGGTGHYFRVTENWMLPADANYFRLETVGGVTMIDSIDIDTMEGESLTSAITFMPASGTTFTDTLEVDATCPNLPSGAVMRYTTDGSEPVATSPSVPTPIVLSDTTTLKCRIFKDEIALSDVRSASYTREAGLSSPEFAPEDGTAFVNSLTVTLETPDSGCTLRFTTDGSEPDASSPAYSGPISISKTCTIKARSFRSGASPSETVSATYRCRLVKTEPSPGSSIATDGAIRITFAQSMDEQSVEAAFALLDGQSQAITGTFNWTGNTLEFTPDAPLVAGGTYSLTIGADAVDADGTPMGEALSLSFAAAVNPVIVCPAVADTYLLYSGMGGGSGYPNGTPSGEHILKVAAALVDARGLMRFDLSSLVYTDEDGTHAYQGSDVISAELQYFMTEATYSNEAMKLGPPAAAGTPMNGFLHALADDSYAYTEEGHDDALPVPDPMPLWDESTTGPGYVYQKTKPGYVNTVSMIPVTHETGPNSKGKVDVTPFVRGWLDGQFANHGMELRDEDDKSMPGSDIEDGYNWFIASHEDPVNGPKLVVTLKRERGLHVTGLRLNATPLQTTGLIRAAFEDVLEVETDATSGLVWKLHNPQGEILSTTSVPEDGALMLVLPEEQAGVHLLEGSDGTHSVRIEIGIANSGTDPVVTDPHHPLFLDESMTETRQEQIRSLCASVSESANPDGSATPVKSPIQRIEWEENGIRTHIGGIGGEDGTSMVIAAIPDATSGFDLTLSDSTDKTLCRISQDAGATSEAEPLLVTAVYRDLPVPGGASRIQEFYATTPDGQPATKVIASGLVLIIACDGEKVGADGFSSGSFHIFHADDAHALIESLQGSSPARIPTSDILTTGEDGFVKFRTDHLSAFGVAAGKPEYEPQPDPGNEPASLGGGCFIGSLR